MGYQALLFCPDEKTARTVTQVLSELEFSVEACTEPFAAVKKLMGEHFDAVVVDCDNEQNATLLFKSARNSTSNQTSLAVAVVEGQAGVAKAFRIGANLVLTKPINIEQAKGTLRVARGLLRKSEPAKPGIPAATPTPPSPAASAAPVKPAPKPVSVAKPAAPPAPVSPTVAASSVPKQVPAVKPATPPVRPAAVATKTTAAAQASNPFEKPAAKATPAATPVAPTGPVTSRLDSVAPSIEKAPEPLFSAAPPVATVSTHATSGAASAPAPARISEPPVANVTEFPAKPVEPTVSEPASVVGSAVVGSAPMFSYGSASEPQTSGGNKKIFLGVAASVVIVAAGYFGWAQFKGHSGGAVASPAPSQQSAPVSPQAATPSVAQATPSPVTATSAARGETTASSTLAPTSETDDSESAPKESASHRAAKPEKSLSSSTAEPAKSAAPEKEEKVEVAPLLVKGGKVPAAQPKSTPVDAAPAPSLIGMATPTSAPPPNLVPSTSTSFKPVLQTVSVSQGVSQGLLYKKVAPVYPSSAVRMRIEGKVELMATVSREGNITQIKVLSGEQQLAKAATDAVKQWKYKPYLLNGEPVEIQTQVTINFKLPN